MSPPSDPTRAGAARARFFGHRLLAWALGCAVVVQAYGAKAQCMGPETAILWSYPADGDTGVPTNVDLWAMPSTEGTLTVTLEGKTLPPSEPPFLYDLGELEPHTRYTVRFELQFLPVKREELSFTTGDGPKEPDPAAAPGHVTASRRSLQGLSEFCTAVLFRGICFDIGYPPERANAYQPSGTAKAWLLQRSAGSLTPVLWPAECGAPLDFERVVVDGRSCATLSGIDALGSVHAGEETCLETEKEASCGLARSSGSRAPLALALSLLACLGLRRLRGE